MSQNSLQKSGPIKASEVNFALGSPVSNQPLVKLSEYYSDVIGLGHFNNPNEDTANFGTHPGSEPLFNPHLSSGVHMRLEPALHTHWATGSILGSDGVSLNSFVINFGQTAPSGSSGQAEADAFGAKVSVGDRIVLNTSGVNFTQAAAIAAATTSLTHFFTNTNVKVTNVVVNNASILSTVAIQFDTEFKVGAGGASITNLNQLSGLLGTYSFTPSDDPNLGIVNNHLTFSRPISFGDLYGDSKSFVHTITSNQSDLNLNAYLVEKGWNQNERVRLTINSTAHIYATSTSNYALTVGAFPQGLEIINNGKITGKGGNGGGTNNAGYAGQAGSNAGPAIHFTAPSEYIITNNGFICGGGGGGASGSNEEKSGGGGGAGGGNGGYGESAEGAVFTGYFSDIETTQSESPGGVGATVPGNPGADGSEELGGLGGDGGEAGGSGGRGSITTTSRKNSRGRASDRRMKRNIKWVAISPEGINIYEFKYLWGFKTYRGVIAQELLDTHPQAIIKGLFGFYKVDYNLIDVEFKVL